MTVEIRPRCENCFWLKVDFNEGVFCEHPKYEKVLFKKGLRKREITLDEVYEKCQCKGEDWVYQEDKLPF